MSAPLEPVQPARPADHPVGGYLKVESREGGAAWITIDRAAKHNALARPVLAELAALVAEVDALLADVAAAEAEAAAAVADAPALALSTIRSHLAESAFVLIGCEPVEVCDVLA